jgi:DNA polymerase
MYDAKPGVEAAGYLQVLEVHDELLTEADDDGQHSAEGLSQLLAVVPDYAPGLPLAASGFESYRYRKD